HEHFRDLLRRMRLLTFVRDIAGFVLRHRALPPLNLRSWILRRPPYRPQFPPWLTPELEAKHGQRFHGQPEIAAKHPVRPEAQRILADPNWSMLFEVWHPSRTGAAIDFVHPYFDRRVVEFLLAIPPLSRFAINHPLREAMRGRLPAGVRT